SSPRSRKSTFCQGVPAREYRPLHAATAGPRVRAGRAIACATRDAFLMYAARTSHRGWDRDEGRDFRMNATTTQRSSPAPGQALRRALAALALFAAASAAHGDPYADAIRTFHDAGESGRFFEHCYGYAVFPTIGKGGIGIGGAHGSGRVYAGGAHVGDTSVNQVTVGFQLGGQAYSQIIFFED